jgi:outer membrane protein assembly complex protein YaeT
MWCVLWGFCVLCSTADADVTDFIGRSVGSVRLVIEGRDTTESTLTQVIETAVGRPLSMAQVRESITHLFSLGRFDDVRVDATLQNGRVALRYDISPIHPVAKLAFTGASGPGIDHGALRRTIIDRYGASPPIGRAADMRRLLQDALRERGYRRASVSIRPETEHESERATLVFAIEPGPRTTISAIDIPGRPGLPRAELLRRLGLAVGAPYRPAAIAQRIERYVEERRARGFYEARIATAVTFSSDERTAALTLALTPGPHVRVVFAGDPLPTDRRAELVPVEREGSVDEDLLEDSSHRIEEFLRGQGYRDAVAEHARRETGGELVITFTVKRGPLYRVSAVDINQNVSVPRAEFEASLRTREGQPFSDAKLDADVATIVDLYRRRGFAGVSANTAVEKETAAATAAVVPVVVRIVVREGVRVIVDTVSFEGNRAVGESAFSANLRLQPGSPYVQGDLAADRDAIAVTYQNLGYESATVDAMPEFSADRTRVRIRFAIREGPRIFVDHVLVVGNVRTRTDTIERELQVKPGDPFSLSAINDSQRRLAALGLFRRARIAELRHGDEATRDLLVTVEEAPPTTVGFGGGVEGKLRAVGATDQFEIAPRAFFEIGRRNLFGKNRSVNFFTSVSLHPPNEGEPVAASAVGYGLPEYRFLFTFREPRLLNTPIDGFANVTFEQQIRSSFNFTRRSASANASRKITRDVAVTGSYQVQRTRVFDVKFTEEEPLINRTFAQFLLSSFSGSVIRDTRDDSVDPSAGQYMSVNSQVAANAIGSEFGFVKSFCTAQTFHAIRGTNRVVLAGNARLGLATGFGNEQLPAEDRFRLPTSERFFAGGDTTVRGFALDRLGVRHVPARPDDTLDKDRVPIGGNGLVIFNAELRAPITRAFGVVAFVDTGNVFARATDLDLRELRSAVGSGIRYKSPFGPLRFDLGFKVHRQEREALTAWFVSFGQAF